METRLFSLVRRAEASGLSPTIVNLLVALMVLLIVSVLLVGVLIVLRQRRKARRGLHQPPAFLHGQRLSTSSVHSFHRRTHAQPSQSIHVFREKQAFEASSDSLPTSSALPEIRITFPEEVDQSGKRQSGHVVVVRVGDSGVGLEPVSESLPLYQQTESGRFQSIDLERIGGLTEKETRPIGWR